MTSGSWGTGKVAVLSNLKEIAERLGCGDTIRQIHQDLTARGEITAGKSAFYKHVRRYCARPDLQSHQHPQQQQTTTAVAGTGYVPDAPARSPSTGRSASRPAPVSSVDTACTPPSPGQSSAAPSRTEALVAGRDVAPGGLRKMKLLNLEGLSADDLLAGHTNVNTLPEPAKDDHDGNH